MKKIQPYLNLIRINKPIGIYLLLWPTLWALVIASKGMPSTKNIIIFTLGTIVMRSIGCALNDIADKDIDHLVARTATRPITNNTITTKNAYFLVFFLLIIAFWLLLFLPAKTWPLAATAVVIAALYPYGKRFIKCPQIILAVAFSWSIPMAFMTVDGFISSQGWALFSIALIWPIIYDTQYAISDREDDIKIGVNSSAIWFGHNDTKVINTLQALYIILWGIFAASYHFHWALYLCLAIYAISCYYQHNLIKEYKPELCQKAFRMHNYCGILILIGIVINYL